MAAPPPELGSPAEESGSLASNRPLRHASFANFQLLPPHLKTTIVAMACSTSRDEAEESSKFLPPLDSQPAKAMSLVSRSFYAVACAVLYSHIRVTRISSLKLLLSAVISRPPLGRLIKRLHIGAGDDCVSRWIPITQSELTLRL